MPSRDLGETTAFYARLGFAANTGWVARYGYLILTRGAVELHFFHAPDVDPQTTASSCYLFVHDADALSGNGTVSGSNPGPTARRG